MRVWVFPSADVARSAFGFLRDKEWPGVGYSLNPDSRALSVHALGNFTVACEEKFADLNGKEIK